MEKNNFNKIDEYKAPKHLVNKSLNETKSNLNTVKSFFEILDLYISKIFNVFAIGLEDKSIKKPVYGLSDYNKEDEDLVDENLKDENDDDSEEDDDDDDIQ